MGRPHRDGSRVWLMHKVKAQYHHSRDFLVTGSVPSQRDRLMIFFRNCGEILQREQAVAAAAAEFQEARKRLTSDPGRMHLDEYARLVALFFAPRHRDAVQRYLRKSDTRQQLDARQAATFNNTIATATARTTAITRCRRRRAVRARWARRSRSPVSLTIVRV